MDPESGETIWALHIGGNDDEDDLKFKVDGEYLYLASDFRNEIIFGEWEIGTTGLGLVVFKIDLDGNPSAFIYAKGPDLQPWDGMAVIDEKVYLSGQIYNPVEVGQFVLNPGSLDISFLLKGCFENCQVTTSNYNDVSSAVYTLRLVPNPARQTIYIDGVGKGSRGLVYNIYTFAGKWVDRGWVEGGQIDIGNLHNGYYNIIIKNESGLIVGSSRFLKVGG